jgi:hypothetical protein
MARAKRKDWPKIEQEWAAGQFSRAEIARQFKIDRKSISDHMAKKRIEYASSADSVRLKAQAKLIDDPEGDGKATGKATPMRLSEAVENAADRQAQVVRLERKDIAALQVLEERLLAELGDEPTKPYITQYQGEIVQSETGISVTERIAALRQLTAARAQRIGLERVAWGIDKLEQGSGSGSASEAIKAFHTAK